MTKIYFPKDDVFNKCVVLQSNDVIRVYDTIPRNNTSYSYRDYYIHDDYYFKEGNGTWGNTFNSLPQCYSSSEITNDYFYRIDFKDILLVYNLCMLIIFTIPIIFLKRFFRRFN